MVRRKDATSAAVGLTVGVLIGLGWNWADSPDSRECARIEAAMGDESATAPGPRAEQRRTELGQAWDNEGCEGHR